MSGGQHDRRVLVSRDALRVLLEWFNDERCAGEGGDGAEKADGEVSDAFKILSSQIWTEVTNWACRHAREHDDLYCQLCGKSFPKG